MSRPEGMRVGGRGKLYSGEWRGVVLATRRRRPPKLMGALVDHRGG